MRGLTWSRQEAQFLAYICWAVGWSAMWRSAHRRFLDGGAREMTYFFRLHASRANVR
jgi:hypothetical protein